MKKQNSLLLLATTAAATHASPTIRGHQQRRQQRPRKRSPHDARPAIQDDRQADRIREWNEARSTWHHHRRLHDTPSSFNLDGESRSHPHSGCDDPHNRKLQDFSLQSYHTKSFSTHYEGTSSLHIKVEQGQDLGFQSLDELNSSSTTTSTATTNSEQKPHPFHPLWNAALTSGVCTNAEGRIPQGPKKRNFAFDSLKECCEAWFYDVRGCMGGMAQVKPNGEGLQLLLRRDVSSGELLPVGEASGSSEESTGDNSSSGGGGQNKYYPSFDMKQYPDGACLNDGKQPNSYSLTPDQFLFDDEEKCCLEWFIDLELCLAANPASDGAPPSPANGGPPPTSFPSWDLGATGFSPWPTWSDDVFNFDPQDSVATTTQATATASSFSSVKVTPEPLVTQAAQAMQESGPTAEAQATLPSSSSSQQAKAPKYSFFESFENGDFSSYPWKLTTSSSSPTVNALTIDPWSAERTALAYDGLYAARPGILTDEGSTTNLTISLNDLDDNGIPDGTGVFLGGLLTFAIHAAVDMPVDAIYFSINGHVLRTFDTVTGYDPGDWEEVSTLLLPGEHTLSWSYQYYGMPEDTSQVDPRRVGNSWVDDIRLLPYTGDYALADGELDVLDMSNGVAPWTVVQDPNAFEGDMSYIAYSQDIVSSRGSIEMSWTIVVSPDGGTVSFAVFASIYAPRDVLEFSVDNVPMAAVTVPSFSWEEYAVGVDPGTHVCTWKLVKNVPGLEDDIIEGVDVPSGYQGYVKVDGIKYVDNMDDVLTTVAATTPVATTTTTTTTAAATTTTTTEIETTQEATTTTSTTPILTTSVATTATATETTVAPETTSVTVAETSSASGSSTMAAETTPVAEASTPEALENNIATEPSGNEATTKAPESLQSTTDSATTAEPSASETPSTKASSSSGCADGLKEVEGLPGCCVEEPNYLGDGACDPWEPYNTEACAYDLGDCCHDTCNEDSPYGCHTKEGADYGPFGFFCIDPRSQSIVVDVDKCKVENREWIGDGGCDADSEYNTPECGYDGGDCCEDTCNQDFAFYTCGANQPFECLSEGGESAKTSSAESTTGSSGAAGISEAPTTGISGAASSSETPSTESETGSTEAAGSSETPSTESASGGTEAAGSTQSA
eukprot:CCRYP_019858-RA/>CCRYP_019858-RA protein AED:0.01 eAED:0.01 QI:287/1/1/1/1/1/3/118/1124